MTSMHDYDTIAEIVGEDKINALREAGVEIGDKPTKPTTNLLGRWATHPYGDDVLIISESVKDNGRVWVTLLTDDAEGGTATIECGLSSLTFPEETTRPEDVPVGEAWLVNIDAGEHQIERSVALKTSTGWFSRRGVDEKVDCWCSSDVTLIAPLVPARPVDSDCEPEPETVTTEYDYAELPDGSIVAEDYLFPYWKEDNKWLTRGWEFSDRAMSGTTRTVLRKGEKE